MHGSRRDSRPCTDYVGTDALVCPAEQSSATNWQGRAFRITSLYPGPPPLARVYRVHAASAALMQFPDDANLSLGQPHFIKTVEDLYEAVVGTVPQAKFGLAFNESSGPCLIRAEGNDDELRNAAIR